MTVPFYSSAEVLDLDIITVYLKRKWFPPPLKIPIVIIRNFNRSLQREVIFQLYLRYKSLTLVRMNSVTLYSFDMCFDIKRELMSLKKTCIIHEVFIKSLL